MKRQRIKLLMKSRGIAESAVPPIADSRPDRNRLTSCLLHYFGSTLGSQLYSLAAHPV